MVGGGSEAGWKNLGRTLETGVQAALQRRISKLKCRACWTPLERAAYEPDLAESEASLVKRTNPRATQETRGRFSGFFMARTSAQPSPLDGRFKHHPRRFNRGVVNALLWLLLVLIPASAVDPPPIAETGGGFVRCSGSVRLVSSLAFASPETRASVERNAARAACSVPSDAGATPESGFQRFLERLEECCGRCYICRP